MKEPEITYRGPAPTPVRLGWAGKLFILGLALVFAAYAFVQWWEMP